LLEYFIRRRPTSITRVWRTLDLHVVQETTHRKAVPPKHLGGDDGKPKGRRTRERMVRNNQRFMRSVEREAKSLSGAKGAPLEQEVITAVGQGGQGGMASGRNTRPNTRPGTPDS